MHADEHRCRSIKRADAFSQSQSACYETCFGDFFLTYDVFNVPAPIPGDANFDGIVDIADFMTLSKNFRKPDDLSVRWDHGDFDLNRSVDFTDFLILSRHFGESRQTALASVPEPDSSAIVILLVCVAWRRTWLAL